ncbi:hypothetical protein [Photobacterium ganghwense]|uniref:hypothetical protein n=1 Tax=Photobacterium ganghwense TaxID=320778 RepID=UPI001C2D9CD3|nr:hypothetical protein [Photobacterium ganghwense]MBV1843287.1 hypothetical protein [Photobacterium ganghwense]
MIEVKASATPQPILNLMLKHMWSDFRVAMVGHADKRRTPLTFVALVYQELMYLEFMWR